MSSFLLLSIATVQSCPFWIPKTSAELLKAAFCQTGRELAWEPVRDRAAGVERMRKLGAGVPAVLLELREDGPVVAARWETVLKVGEEPGR